MHYRARVRRYSRTTSGWRPGAALLGLLLGCPAMAEADRILSVLPAAQPDTWIVEAVSDAQPVVWVDGVQVDARAEHLGEDRYRIRVEDVSADAGQLGIGRSGPLVAVRLHAVPEQAKPFNDLIVYHIMVAYFANGASSNDRSGMRRWVHRNYAGGDLQGVLSKADYLAELGVNAVWLSPIFQSETSHGYDVMNYYRVSDALAVPGDAEASLALYRQMVAALGEHGIRVILDMPLNHAAGGYDKRRGDPDRLKPKSTSAKQDAEKVWESWGTGLRFWNFRHQDTRRFLKNAALYWLGEEGAGGLRLDYVRGVEHEFWAELYAEVKQEQADDILFGEAWLDADGPAANMVDISSYYAEVPGIGYQFDSLIEFPMQMVMTEVFARGGDVDELERWLQAETAAYGSHGAPMYFLDNHDMTRFADWAIDAPRQRVLAAVTFMASLPGPMSLYYGTETALGGSTAQKGFTDTNRVRMPWDKLDQALVAEIAAVFRTKRSHPVLTHGARLPLMADQSGLIMARQRDGETALVAVNMNSEARVFELEFPLDAGNFRALVGSTAPEIRDGRLRWELPALTTGIAVQE